VTLRSTPDSSIKGSEAMPHLHQGSASHEVGRPPQAPYIEHDQQPDRDGYRNKGGTPPLRRVARFLPKVNSRSTLEDEG